VGKTAQVVLLEEHAAHFRTCKTIDHRKPNDEESRFANANAMPLDGRPDNIR
jgi:hypothetical protein